MESSLNALLRFTIKRIRSIKASYVNDSKEEDEEVLARLLNFSVAFSLGESIVSKELLENSLMCIEKGHETEPLDHNCKKCKVSICDRCGKTRHTQHTKVNIQQATEEEKLKMEETIEQMKMQISELETQITETLKTLAIRKEKISAFGIVCKQSLKNSFMF